MHGSLLKGLTSAQSLLYRLCLHYIGVMVGLISQRKSAATQGGEVWYFAISGFF